jgi:hypothetical protein
MSSRKYTPPVNFELEPKTRKEILELIADLQERRPGSAPQYQAAIDDYIEKLQERLRELK